ncbi:ATP-binding protein [Nonomuraea sp. NPDC049709]|uniref:ATP-binding protein n=1 Tax=Nonomuraea sp. NPDC049709 TaxID=3154736 RepID=UPI0034409075
MGWVRAEEAGAVGAVRRKAVALAEAAGFDQLLVSRLAVAVSEAVSNLVKHAREGAALVRPHPEAPATVELIALDRGPGMADVARALRDGYSTSGTLGIGLGAISRSASGYDVHSLPGKGTVLAMYFTAGRTARPPLRASGVTRAGGDGFAVHRAGPVTTVLVCDAAARLLPEVGGQEPQAVVARLGAATAGAGIAVARVEPGRVSFAGLGDVSGWVVHGGRRQGLTPRDGARAYALPAHATVVLHTGGLAGRWDPAALPGLFTRTPAVIAAALMREADGRGDDVCVVTVRPGRDGA